METRTCRYCDGPMNLPRRGAKFCSQKCGTYFRRELKRSGLPDEMTSRDRWMRRSALKRPLTVAGKAASSTDPSTWSSYASAVASKVGAGLGFALGDGIGCYDLDHCFTDGVADSWVAEFIRSIPEPVLFMEVSQSGEGVHVFIEAPEGPGSKTRNGQNIERYTSGRYIAVTGKAFKL